MATEVNRKLLDSYTRADMRARRAMLADADRRAYYLAIEQATGEPYVPHPPRGRRNVPDVLATQAERRKQGL